MSLSSRARALAPWAALAACLAWSTYLRLRLVAAGPDPDTDAYLHYHIGMRLASEWRRVTLHWVWLPLWHVVGAAAHELGLGITALRYLSVACTAATTLMLAALLREHLARHPSPAPWAAEAERAVPLAGACLFTLWPLNLRGGASAEPEALFQMLLVAAALAWQRGRATAAGAALALAAMLRYEAWPVVAAFAGMWRAARRPWREAVAWALPAAAVALWCVVHRAATGEWGWFLRENRAYVEDAWREFRLAERRPPSVRLAPVWYAAALPAIALREWTVWLVPGLAWFVRRGPRALAWTTWTLLAVVTAVWITRRNLGLERHFAALVPAYATMAVAGLVVTVAWVGRRAPAPLTRAVTVACLALAASGFLRWRVPSADRAYRRTAAGAWVAERRAAEILRAEALPDATVFTQNVRVKVFAGIPLARYVGWRPADLRDFNLLVESAHHGEAWVFARPWEVAALRDGAEVRHRDAAWVLLRRRAPAPVDPALLRERPCR